MIVYLITNKINGKKYVGQTIQLLKVRWSKHCHVSEANKGMPVVNAIQKYGPQNFDKDVLIERNSIKEMNYWEKFYIESLNTLTPNGYNILSGGENSLHTEETKRKIADAQTGEKNHNFGKKASLETRNKMSKSRTGTRKSEDERKAISERVSGEKHPMFGKHHTAESIEKISKAQMGRVFSIETRDKLAKSKEKVSVRVYCHQTKEIYRSISQASKVLLVDRCKIKDVIRGKRNHTKGFTFEYVK